MIPKNENAPILILHGSKQPYLSVGVHYGGIKAYGYDYDYIPPQDAFLRHDHLKTFNKHRKEGGNWESFVELIKTI